MTSLPIELIDLICEHCDLETRWTLANLNENFYDYLEPRLNEVIRDIYGDDKSYIRMFIYSYLSSGKLRRISFLRNEAGYITKINIGTHTAPFAVLSKESRELLLSGGITKTFPVDSHKKRHVIISDFIKSYCAYDIQKTVDNMREDLEIFFENEMSKEGNDRTNFINKN